MLFVACTEKDYRHRKKFLADGRESYDILIKEFTHRTMSAAPIAPAWRATSRPCRNRISVGMLRMPNCALTPGAASVSSLARRIRGSSCAAACSNAGAIILQVPYHAAQKTTSTKKTKHTKNKKNKVCMRATGWPVNRAR